VDEWLKVLRNLPELWVGPVNPTGETVLVYSPLLVNDTNKQNIGFVLFTGRIFELGIGQYS
jgi:hypothetical protein